jgi:hypothetical protein
VFDGGIAIVSGASDAARVDDNPTVTEADDAGNVGVPAQDQGGRNPGRLCFDMFDRRRLDDRICGDALQPVGVIAVWRAMAKEHFVPIDERRRQARKPFEVAALQPRASRLALNQVWSWLP